MNFTKALAAMERGFHVARRSWEKSHSVALSPPGIATTASAMLLHVRGASSAWTPTQEDLTANDWRQTTSRPCNLCGLPCGCEDDADMGLVDAKVYGGYESTPGNGNGALDDCNVYTFSLCEFCLDWLFANCRIPPKIEHYSAFDVHDTMDEGTQFRPAGQRVAEDEWRRGKEAFFAEADRRTAARGFFVVRNGAK